MSTASKLDDFLVAAGEHARAALEALPKIPLSDVRFRFVAQHETHPPLPEGEKLSPKEALKVAKKDLVFFLHEAETAPDGLIQQALKYPWFLQSLALLAERNRGDFEAAMMQLRAGKMKDKDVRALERAVTAERKKRRNFRVIESRTSPSVATLTTVRSLFATAPVPDSVVVPLSWRLDAEGVRVERARGTAEGDTAISAELIMPAPLVIAGRLKEVSNGAESLRLAWVRDGRWQQQTAPRGVIANARQLVDLANAGLPVTSNTASDVVEYLAAFEATNLSFLPRAKVSPALGWQGEGGKGGFLWGRSFIRPSDGEIEEINLDVLAPERWQEDVIAFRGSDPGDEQFVDGFSPAGSFSQWKETVALVAEYPRALLGLYASFVPPLLSIFGTSNFGIDWAGMTSHGKTTVLRVAASVWGCPDERAPATVLWNWDVTRVWVERASTLLNALPLILDDTKRAKKPHLVGQTIYDVANGRGRGRGSPKGMRRSGSWTTVLLSTGEAPATSFTQDGGTHARMLELWGSPWGKADEETAYIVQMVNAGVLTHYGHAGPQFIQYLLHHRDTWEQWREAYLAKQAEYHMKAGADPVAGRCAAYFAALVQTAVLVHEALELPWEYTDPIAVLWNDLTREATQADRAAIALACVMSWAIGHEQEFFGRHLVDSDGTPRQPHAGWAGKWEKDDNWETIAFLPHRLTDILKSQGFEPEAIFRLWGDREWLETDGDRKRHRRQIRLAGTKIRAIVIKRQALQEAEEKEAEAMAQAE